MNESILNLLKTPDSKAEPSHGLSPNRMFEQEISFLRGNGKAISPMLHEFPLYSLFGVECGYYTVQKNKPVTEQLAIRPAYIADYLRSQECFTGLITIHNKGRHKLAEITIGENYSSFIVFNTQGERERQWTIKNPHPFTYPQVTTLADVNPIYLLARKTAEADELIRSDRNYMIEQFRKWVAEFHTQPVGEL